MRNFETFFKSFLKELQVELTDEFDRNFERKAFFTDDKWQQRKNPAAKGSLMNQSGTLRRSIKSSISGNNIIFTSSRIDADIHNQGGTITVTAKMKKFFWAMYFRATNAVTYKVKNRKADNNARNRKLSTEAAYWKSLALMKTGSKLTIPKRQFIGHHPQVDAAVKSVLDEEIKNFNDEITEALKKATNNK